MNDKIDKIKKIYDKLKKAAMWLSNGLGQIFLFALSIILLFYVFSALSESIMGLIAGAKRNFFFLIQGRSGSIDEEAVYRTKYELEQQGIDFDEIGYLGDEFLLGDDIVVPTDDGSFLPGVKLSDPEVIVNIGSFSSGDTFNNVEELIEYKEALEDEITRLKEEEKVAEIEGTSTSLTSRLNKNKGKTVFVKLAREVTPTDPAKSPYTKYEYFLADVDSDGSTYTRWNIEDDVYYAFNDLKTKAIFCYLAKYLQAQAYTFNNNNPWTFDSSDQGSITANFANDTEKQECDDIGFWQRLFEGTTGSFSVYMQDEDFFVKIGKPEMGKNIKITSYVNDFAMPWRYPFAFHNSTLAPDIGYKVSDLVYDHHKLEIDLFTVGRKEIRFEYRNGHDNNSIGQSHNSQDDYTYDAIRGTGDVIAVPDYISTWYRKENYEYEEVIDESTKTRVGSIYDKVGYILIDDTMYYSLEFDGSSIILEFFDDLEDTFNQFDSKFFDLEDSMEIDSMTENERLNECKEGEISTTISWFGEDVYCEIGHTYNEKIADVYAYDKILRLKNHTVTLNDAGVSEMDGIVESVPRYQYDSTGGKLEIQNPSDLKYYYTANSFQESSTKNGKTMLNIPTNAQSIVDAVYDIYDIGADRNAAKDIESQFAKDPTKLSSGKINEGLSNDNHYRRDYNSAPKMVKDLICYFYEMGVIDDSDFSSVYSESAIFSDMLRAGTSIIWPLKESTDQVSALIGNKINCPAGTEVVSPVEGKIISINDNGNGSVDITISRDIIVEGSPTGTTDTIILSNLSKTGLTVSVGSKVNPGQKLGVSAGAIEYTHINVDGTDVSLNDLSSMRAMAMSEFKLPVRNSKLTVTSPFGWRSRGFHSGIDFTLGQAGLIKGEPIYASKAGTVVKSEALKKNGEYVSYGEMVVIDHGDNTYTLYAHMLPSSRKVSVGQSVDENTVLGNVGTTGNSTGYHLHFEIRVGANKYDNCVDPAPYLFNTKSTAETEVPDDVDLNDFTATGGGKFRITYFTPQDNDGGGYDLSSGAVINPSSIHPELGCFTYNGKIVLAGALESRVNNQSISQDWSRRDYIHYFNEYDEVAIEFNGQTYVGIVLDICGVSMNPEGRKKDGGETSWAGDIGQKNTLDVFFPSKAAANASKLTGVERKVIFLSN